MKSRVVLIFIGLTGFFGLILTRFFYLQLPNSNLDSLQKNLYMTVVSLPPQRGRILDRKGEELATTVTAYSLYADAILITKPKGLSRKLSGLLKVPAKEIFNKLAQGKRFVWIKRQLDSETVAIIKSWNERGLGFIEEGKRSYPNQVASSLLGFVGRDNIGLEGLERQYDKDLKGEKQTLVSRRDARGRPLLVNGQLFELNADGQSIQTTIDKELQYEVERQLEKVTLEQRAERAMGLVMDPATGEVLAMASYPNFENIKRNHPVTDSYEPGSTFKIVAIAAALRTGRIQPNTKFFCENGTFKIGKRVIHESEAHHKYKWLTLSQILELSSNIGTTKVAFDVGQVAYRDMMSSLGFLSKTGVDFPGEASGFVERGNWPAHLFSNVSFGHGITVTALQMANAYSAIANGGQLMRPYLVKRIFDGENRESEARLPQVMRQVFSTKEANTLKMLLSGATEEGSTGTLARVDGYPVAGKTGTAQKVDLKKGGYIKGGYLSSFVGFVPAANPQFTIYILVDHPKKHFYGAQVAAPVFNKIASFALRQKGFMPLILSEKALTSNTTPTTAKAMESARNFKDGIVPDFEGLTIREVSDFVEKNKISNLRFYGSGVARTQIPAAGSPLMPNQKIKVYFQPFQ